MAKIVFDFDIDGRLPDEPFLDHYELEYMFRQTQENLLQALERKLEGISCDEHGQEPTITISGRYNGETEQMNLEYHIDTCCQIFMVQIVKMLNNIN
jgi:hypothetical protein